LRGFGAPSLFSCLLPLAFLVPEIVKAIASGRHPADLTAQTLIDRIVLPIHWAIQERMLGSV